MKDNDNGGKARPMLVALAVYIIFVVVGVIVLVVHAMRGQGNLP